MKRITIYKVNSINHFRHPGLKMYKLLDSTGMIHGDDGALNAHK